jgi:hypothetical protein
MVKVTQKSAFNPVTERKRGRTMAKILAVRTSNRERVMPSTVAAARAEALFVSIPPPAVGAGAVPVVGPSESKMREVSLWLRPIRART